MADQDTARTEDTIVVKDGRLIVNVALQNPVKSRSGKSEVFYTTRGNVDAGDGFKVGINLYK